jgi:hypothetical protein
VRFVIVNFLHDFNIMLVKRVLPGSLLGSLVAAYPSYGCGESLLPKPVEWTPKPGEVKLFTVNSRPIRVTVPDNYNKMNAAPVIIGLHDRDQTKEYFEYDGAFYNNDINPNAIMVFPEAEQVRGHSTISFLTTAGSLAGRLIARQAKGNRGRRVENWQKEEIQGQERT